MSLRPSVRARRAHRAPRAAALSAFGLTLILLATGPLVLAAMDIDGAVFATPSEAAPSGLAQRAIAYRLVDQWTSIRPTNAYTALDWEEGHIPGGVGVNALATRFVATDRTADTVRVYGDEDRLLATLGSPGSGPTELDDPRDAQILRDRRIAVSDTGNDRVQLLEASGGLAASWPVADPRGIGAETVNLGLPGEKTIVMVVSAAERKLLLFSPDGTPAGEVSLSGTTEPDALADVELRLGPGSEPQVTAAVVDAADGRLHFFAPGETASVTLARPGLRAALALRPPDAPPGQVGEPAWWLGVTGMGLVLRDAAGKPFPPETTLPFAAVHDLGRPRRNSGRTLAAVEPEGLIVIDEAPTALADRLAADTAGRLFGPNRIAVGEDVLLADRLPRIAIYDRDGAVIDSASVPPPPLSNEKPRAADVAAEGSQRFALATDGRLLAESRNGFSRFRAAATDRPTYRWAIDADGGRLIVLDLLTGRVERLDEQLDVIDDWPLANNNGSTLPADLARAGETTYLAAPGEGVLETRTATGQLLDKLPVSGIPERVAALPGTAFVLTAAGWIHRYDIGGNLIAAWPVAEAGQRPVDLAVDEEERVYVVDERGAVRVYAPDLDAPAPTLPPQGSEGTCTVAPDKRAVPNDIELGETVTVTLSLAGSCAVPAAPVDVVLAVDRSSSMADEGKLDAAVEATAAFALHLDPSTARLGVVDFADTARQVVPLIADGKPAIIAVTRFTAGGDTDLVGGVREATAQLLAEGRPDTAGHIVLLTDGRHTAPGTPADEIDEAAFVARAAGLTLHAVALGDDADLAALDQIAGAPERLHRSPGPFELAGIYARIARGLGSTELFAGLVITDRIPANMELVPDSAVPPAELIEDGRTLQWRLSDVAGPLLRLQYQLRPLAAGSHPTNREALAGGKDPLGIRHDLVFPIPTVHVRIDGRLPTATTPPTATGVPPTATPTPTATASPEPTATVGATSTPSVTPTPSATPTTAASATTQPSATAEPTATIDDPIGDSAVIYLPLVSNVRCPTGRKPIDVVLVLDTSLSMDTIDTPGGPTRREASTSAASDFIDLLDLGRDRAAIVGFNDNARLAAALTSDRGRLRTALSTLPAAPGTRIDRGLDAAAAALAPAVPGRVPVLVLLTDGAADGASVANALVSAQRLHRAGITVFVIGLGADVDATLLRLVASTPGLYLPAPDPDELGAAFRAVASQIPCG